MRVEQHRRSGRQFVTGPGRIESACHGNGLDDAIAAPRVTVRLLVPVQLHRRQLDQARYAGHVLLRLIDEHADSRDERRQLRDNGTRALGVDEPRARGPEHEPDRIRAKLGGQPGVFQPSHATDLHPRSHQASLGSRRILADCVSSWRAAPGSGCAISRSPTRNAS